MSSDREMQSNFISWVKEKADQNQSFVDDLAELLNVSKDSAYRRVRGETLLTFNEISKISAHYKVSLDSFLNLSSSAVVFNTRQIGKNLSFTDYLRSLEAHLRLVSGANEKNMIWAAKDIPILHYFQSPALTKFKLFFWQKTIVNAEDQDVDHYDPESMDQEMVSITKSIWNLYCKIPSSEIWSDETLNITLRQIEYYYECGLITKDETLHLIDEFIGIIRHLKKLASVGRKYPMGGDDYPDNGSYHLFYNEIAIGDNTIFFQINEKKVVFLTYNMLNVLSTMDDDFCNETEHYLQNILHKSTPLSVSSEKERNNFFRNMEMRIDQMKERISH